MNDFLTFRRYITPVFIQIIFWIGVLAIVITAIAEFTRDFGSDLRGVLLLFFGPVFWRVYCELLILLFRMNDNVVQIRRNTALLVGEEPPPIEPPAATWPAPASTWPAPVAPPESALVEAPSVAASTPQPISEAVLGESWTEPLRPEPETEREHEVTATYPRQRFCTQCGAKNAVENRFCESCGKPLQA